MLDKAKEYKKEIIVIVLGVIVVTAFLTGNTESVESLIDRIMDSAFGGE